MDGRGISAILFAVRFSGIFLISVATCALLFWGSPHIRPANAEAGVQGPAASQAPATKSASGKSSTNGSTIAGSSSAGIRGGLDPEHGGADTGARGESGAIEKDVVLEYARAARAELERQGYRVVLTRNDDSDPSYDDRDALANAHIFAVFISLHVASTGTIGTARAYFYKFWTPIPPPSATDEDFSSTAAAPARPAAESSGCSPGSRRSGLFRMRATVSRSNGYRFSSAQAFSGSPGLSQGVGERELRSVTGPAIAVEISSVSVPDPKSLAAFDAPLATAMAKAVAAFRTSNSAGAK